MKKANKKVAKTTVKAKGKKAAAAESLPVKAPRKLDISRARVEIGTGQLKPAPWNPRGEISAESVADLVASIATVGIIEPLVVMESESGKDYIIIAGHRRAKAAALAECKTVPCDVLRGIDVATAKRMTFIENLQRRDADPILESNLVAELVADGMTTDEIAAEIGRDRKWVLRRKNLSNLSPSWRKRIEKGEKITTDCLEHIAAFPKDVQERLKKTVHITTALFGGVISRGISTARARALTVLYSTRRPASPAQTTPAARLTCSIGPESLRRLASVSARSATKRSAPRTWPQSSSRQRTTGL